MPDPESLLYDGAAGSDHPECCVSHFVGVCSRPGMSEDCVAVGLELCEAGDDDCTSPDDCLDNVKSPDVCGCCKCSEHGTEPIWSRNENPPKYHCLDLPESVEDFFCLPKSHEGAEVKQCRVEKNNNYHCHMLPEYILDQQELDTTITDAKVDACCITHWQSGGDVRKPEGFQDCCKGERITC
jgi:hypothetical protein